MIDNRLTVLRVLTIGRRLYYRCLCECGTIKTIRADSVQNGRVVSCGCYNQEQRFLRRRTHGKSQTRDYKIWKGMIARCYNPARKGYKTHGGRGITVCDRWRGPHGFENFTADMGPSPTNKHTIERKNNHGNYEPDNCIWDTRYNQARNRRTNHLLTFRDKTQCVLDWSKELNLSRSKIYYRLKIGWSIEKTLSTP